MSAMADFRKTDNCKGFKGYWTCLYFYSRMEISLTDRLRNCYDGSRWIRLSYREWKEERQTGLVTSCVRTAFYNTL